jgi:hypothetical protein
MGARGGDWPRRRDGYHAMAIDGHRRRRPAWEEEMSAVRQTDVMRGKM